MTQNEKEAGVIYSIIIVTHNSAADLPGCLNSIVESSGEAEYEVIIVDNASDDGSEQIFKALEGDVTVVRNHYNAGYARAANMGISAAKGKYLVFMNPDTMATPKWLSKLSAHLEKTGAGAVGPLSNYVAGIQKYELYYAEQNIKTPADITRGLEHYYSRQSAEAKMLIGFCLMVPRKVINAIGMFDDDLLLGSEDLEYSHRLKSRGYELVVALDTFIYHKGHTSYEGETESERWNNLSACVLQNKIKRASGDFNSRKIWGIDWFQPKADAEKDMVSIVIPVFNGLKFTKLCLDSIRRNTIHPYEIIVVDNGSTDGTREYLQNQPGIKLIENSVNRGFPAACNQGIKVSQTPYVLLLNNDVLVTEYWLSRMFQGFFAYQAAGLIGPRSNDAAGYQQIKAPALNSAEEMNNFAAKIKNIAPRQFREVDYLSGFALLIDLKVIERIGGLDERFGLGNYEDEDFCKRAIAAGFKLLVANEVFLYHFGSQSFLENHIDYQNILQENRAKFEQKWQTAAL